MRKWKLVGLIALCAGLLCIPAGVIGYKAYTKAQGPFSKQIRKQVAFTIFYPDEELTGYKIKRETVKYDTATKVLSYVISGQATPNSFIVSMQASPEVFADVPEYYPKFIEKLSPVASFDSKVGKVTITQSPNLKGDQSAVLYSQGSLLFVRGKAMPTDEWRKFFIGMKAL